jgi:hypothetical protein
MVDDDFTQTLNAFATKFKVPAIEIYALAAECIVLGKRCQRMADIEEGRATSARRGGPRACAVGDTDATPEAG